MGVISKQRARAPQRQDQGYIYSKPNDLIRFLRPTGLERDLELERRKNREHQEQLRERDKEYSKLKVGITKLYSSHGTLINDVHRASTIN